MRDRVRIVLPALFLMAVACLALPVTLDSKTATAEWSPLPQGVPSPALQAACPAAQEHSLPLPTSVPSDKFVDFEKQFLAFLQDGKYKELHWCVDKSIRDTGPYQHAIYYGTHPAVKIYYSPKVMQWLTSGRQGAIADGAMIIKEQYAPAASQYNGRNPTATDWTIMLKDSKGSKDGWFWGEFSVGMTFDDNKYPFQYPGAGFGIYCVRCHGTAEKEHTFSSLNNIKGFPGEPIKFPDDHLRSLTPPTNHVGTVFPLTPLTPGRNLDPKFLQTFTSIPGVPFDKVQQMIPETYDDIPAPPTGAGQFIASNQCMSCHGGLNAYGPFGPTMFLPSSPSPKAPQVSGANISPYGEWRWSPMGLAGRDPIFFSQLDSEFAYFNTLRSPKRENDTTMVRNACLTCHGAMGKRQLDSDSEAAGKGPGDFQLSFLGITNRHDPNFKYGGLARDGISCQVCHRNAPAPPAPPGTTPLEYFLKNYTTGHFPVSQANELYGPFKDDEISPYAMETATGIKPKFNSYLQSSRMCGSCHTIDLPVLDSGNDGVMSIEQATYLEWLNSGYQTEFGTPGPHAKSCGDCHMPTEYHNKAKGIDDAQIQQQIAIIEDQNYPEAEGRVANDQINVRDRKEGFRRHEFLGLNVFLLELLNQSNDILGVRKGDYMTGSTTDLQDAVDNYMQQAQSATARITASSRVNGAGQIQADVAVTNLAGHRFPSGVGFRRAFLELLVTDSQQNVVWASGRTNSVGVIVDGDGKPLPSEFFAEYTDSHGKKHQSYQPHYEVINAQNQVQIYEELNQDATGKFTTNFTLRDHEVKDNRLLPLGWTEKGPDPSLSGRYLEATHPKGNAAQDPDYQDGKATDHITYKIQLPPGVDATKCHVQATLYYQSIPPYYLSQRFAAAPNAEATQRLYYLTSTLNLTSPLRVSPVKNWKLPIVSTAAVGTTPQMASSH